MGAFLVSAAWDGKQVSEVSILSEKGAPLVIVNPWGQAPVRITPGGTAAKGAVIHIPTRAGERYEIARA